MHVEKDNFIDYSETGQIAPAPGGFTTPQQTQQAKASVIATLSDPLGRMAVVPAAAPVSAPDYSLHTTPVLSPVVTTVPAVVDTSGNILQQAQQLVQSVIAPVPTQDFPRLDTVANNNLTPKSNTTNTPQTISVTTQSGLGEAIGQASKLSPLMIVGLLAVGITIYLIIRK